MFFVDQQCSRNCVTLAVLLIGVTACARPKPLPSISQHSAELTATTIVREVSYPNVELAALRRGRLEVVVRSTERPTQFLGGAQVQLRIGARDSVVRTTDDQGLAVFESIPIGEHELLARRIGYGRARAVVSIKPGCRTDAEAYIGISAMGLDPPLPTPSRIIQTTCR